MEFDCDGHVLTLSFKPPPAGSSWWIKEKEYRVVSKANLKMWRFSEFLGEKKALWFCLPETNPHAIDSDVKRRLKELEAINSTAVDLF